MNSQIQVCIINVCSACVITNFGLCRKKHGQISSHQVQEKPRKETLSSSDIMSLQTAGITPIPVKSTCIVQPRLQLSDGTILVT